MSEENLDIRKLVASYLGILYRALGYWKWGVSLCLVVTLAGTVFAATRRKIWSSSTRIRVVAAQVNDSEFGGGGEGGMGDQLKTRINHFIAANRFLQEIIDQHGLYREEKAAKNMTEREVLDYMRTKIETGVWGDDEYSFVFYDYDPRVAKTVTESLARSFMNREKGDDYEVFQTKLASVEKQLGALETQLDQLTTRQTKFREVNADIITQLDRRTLGAVPADPVVSATQGISDTLPSANDSPQLRRLRNQLKTLIDSEAAMNAKAGASAENPVLASQAERVREQVAQARQRYNRLREQYTDQWPDVRNAQAQLSQLEAEQRRVEAELRESKRASTQPSAELTSLRNQIRETRDEVQRLTRLEAAERQKVAATTPGTPPNQPAAPQAIDPGSSEVPLKSMEEVASTLKRMEIEIRPVRERVENLTIQRLKLQFQVKQAEQGGVRHEVIDHASLPTKPSGPNRTKYALVSATAGLLIGCGLMVLLGFVDSRVYRPSDMSRIDHIPLLGSIPDFEREMNEIAALNAALSPQDQQAEYTDRGG